MRVTLVQAPVITRLQEMVAPPLGLLTLGALLRDQDVEVSVVDFNLESYRDSRYREAETFYQPAIDRITATEPDLVGFTSMALESHVCLELARLLKAQDPRVKTVFGGPHFGSIAGEILEHYSWADYVVVGSGEQAIIDLVAHLRDGAPAADVANIAHRTISGVTLDRRPERTLPLAAIPLPAYELVDLEAYFAINPVALLHVEHARGCQLRCSFCYSEAHWGHGETAKPIGRVVEELKKISALGARSAFFVADNFVTSPPRARALCAAMNDAGIDLKWTCYATLAQLDEQTVAAMGAAGCRSVFVGVDAVSASNKKAFRKTYFKGWPALRETIERCLTHHIVPTCSFMLSSADTADGIEQTLQAAAFAKHIGAEVTVNALAIYHESGLHRSAGTSAIEYEELKPRLHYDTPPINFVNPYAKEHPALFPMHQRPPQHPAIGSLHEFTHVGRQLIMRNPLTMTRLALDRELPLRILVRRVATALHETLASGTGLQEFAVYRRALRECVAILVDEGCMNAVLFYELRRRQRPSERHSVGPVPASHPESPAHTRDDHDGFPLTFEPARLHDMESLVHDGSSFPVNPADAAA